MTNELHEMMMDAAYSMARRPIRFDLSIAECLDLCTDEELADMTVKSLAFVCSLHREQEFRRTWTAARTPAASLAATDELRADAAAALTLPPYAKNAW